LFFVFVTAFYLPDLSFFAFIAEYYVIGLVDVKQVVFFSSQNILDNPRFPLR